MKTSKLIGFIAGLTMCVTGFLVLVGDYYLGQGVIQFWPVMVTLFGFGMTAAGFISVLHKEEKSFSISDLSFMRGKHKWEVWAAKWTLETLEKLGMVAESPVDSYRQYAGFFIPGIPILVTGFALLYANIMNRWEIWAVAWTLIILALAIGFAFAGVFMRVAGLAVPAFIIGVNALVLEFCANTGLWQAWIVLWPIEFLAIGLGLLTLSIANGSPGVKTGAIVLFTIAGAGFFISSFLGSFVKDTLIQYITPAMILLTGFLLTMAFFIKERTQIPLTA